MSLIIYNLSSAHQCHVRVVQHQISFLYLLQSPALQSISKYNFCINVYIYHEFRQNDTMDNSIIYCGEMIPVMIRLMPLFTEILTYSINYN